MSLITPPEKMPQNLEAEAYLIGQLLHHPEEAWAVRSMGLQPKDFWGSLAAMVWEKILVVQDAGGTPGLPAVMAQILDADQRIAVTDWADDMRRMPPYVERLALMIQDCARRCRMITAAIHSVAMLSGGDPYSTENAESLWSDAVARGDNGNELSLIEGVRAHRERRLSDEPLERGHSIGIPELDDFGLIQPGDLTVIAARPSMGKSALATTIAANLGLKGTSTLFISLEVGSQQSIANMICGRAAVPHSDVRTEGLIAQKLATVEDALANAPILFRAPPSLTAEALRALIRVETVRNGVEVVILDYLQLLTARERKDRSREQEVSEMSRTLKMAAVESGVSIIVLCQLNRNVESRIELTVAGKKIRGLPRLSDLRDSGAIEQDADRVWMLYRPAYYDAVHLDPTRRQDTWILIAKSRSGPTGRCTLDFIPAATSFSSQLLVDYTPTAPEDIL